MEHVESIISVSPVVDIVREVRPSSGPINVFVVLLISQSLLLPLVSSLSFLLALERFRDVFQVKRQCRYQADGRTIATL